MMGRNEEKGVEVGKSYKISLEDCCIVGTIDAGKYLKYHEEEDLHIFENCEIGPHWGAWTAKEDGE